MFNYSYIITFLWAKVKLFVYLFVFPGLRIGGVLRLTASLVFATRFTVYG
jgi:hypothetical protein